MKEPSSKERAQKMCWNKMMLATNVEQSKNFAEVQKMC